MQALKKRFEIQLQPLYSKEEINIMFSMIIEFILKKKYDKSSDVNLKPDEIGLFESYMQKLMRQIPIQYILGEAYFYRLIFKVNENVLIPRSETEELVQLVIKHSKNKAFKILDIGTGSGCISIALKKNLPQAKITAIDISEDALEIAKQNALFNDVAIDFFKDDALNLNPSNYSVYDVIVSNPPYISKKEIYTMDKQVTDHEPHLALFVDDDFPLLFYDKISDFAITNLRIEGFLFFEINQALAEKTQQLLLNKGFKVEILKDINANDRMMVAQLLG